jgi:hypothetical protein
MRCAARIIDRKIGEASRQDRGDGFTKKKACPIFGIRLSFRFGLRLGIIPPQIDNPNISPPYFVSLSEFFRDS